MEQMLNVKAMFVMVLAAGLGGALSAGCSSSPCSSTSKCPADPVVSEQERTQCQKNYDAMRKCKAEATNYQNCLSDKRVCGTDNLTDDTKTQQLCSPQASALAQCQAQGGVDGGF